MNKARLAMLAVLAALPAICPLGPARAEPAWRCERWPEADALFHRDPRWRGGDGAASIDLGGGRILWTFGDTFIAPPDSPQRPGSSFLRNTIGIQTGADPTSAKFHTYWRTSDGKPSDFFAAGDGQWLWPGHGAALGDRLLLFFMRLEKRTEWPRFAVVGWTARLVENPADAPTNWRIKHAQLPAWATGRINLAGSALATGDHLYVYGTAGGLQHPGVVARWDIADARRGDLRAAESWDAQAGQWSPVRDAADLPVVLPHAQEEYTVLRSKRFDRLLQVQTQGYPVGEVALRTGAHPQGPWSRPTAVYAPTEHAWGESVSIYSAKAHPEQTCRGLAITYCTNSEDFTQLVNDERIYYPRFLRLTRASGSVTTAAPLAD